jgi:hypothetical protein
VKTKNPNQYKTDWGYKKMPATTYSPTFCYVVPSAMKGLTSVFGMGTGMTPSL